MWLSCYQQQDSEGTMFDRFLIVFNSGPIQSLILDLQATREQVLGMISSGQIKDVKQVWGIYFESWFLIA
jgi:hypothetical protein